MAPCYGGLRLKFIVVDGLDGCGKNTHAERIRRSLVTRGENVTVISHPSQRLFGRLTKRALEGSGPAARFFATLFFSADVLTSVSKLKRKRDGTMIFVRYILGTAYLPERLAPTGYELFKKVLPFPDLAIFIDIDPIVAKRRISMRGHRHEMFETVERLSSVRKVAKSLIGGEWVTIDNSEDGENPFIETERVLNERLA